MGLNLGLVAGRGLSSPGKVPMPETSPESGGVGDEKHGGILLTDSHKAGNIFAVVFLLSELF
jgi:hypothetical protein